jgi:hypothetical protein
MGPEGGTLAAAAKSARVLLLGPLLVVFAVRRHAGATARRWYTHLPGFLLGYLLLALARLGGDRLFAGEAAWRSLLQGSGAVVTLSLCTVAAGIGLSLDVRHLVTSSARAMVVGGAASAALSGTALVVVALGKGGRLDLALLGGLGAAFVALALRSLASVRARPLEERLSAVLAGSPVGLLEGTRLLDFLEARDRLDDQTLRALLLGLSPTAGELAPLRDSPLAHGAGCRWLTYWQGQSGWALVALCRDPGAATPIHTHPHALFTRPVVGAVEELRFEERAPGQLSLVARRVVGGGEVLETPAQTTVHLVRALGDSPVIDLQLRGPEEGRAGRVFHPVSEAPAPDTWTVGQSLSVREAADARPGHRGEGAGAGRVNQRH